jgi:hypothetical protein
MDAMGETMIFLPRITLPMTTASGCTYVDGSITGPETFLQKSAVTFFSIIFASVFEPAFSIFAGFPIPDQVEDKLLGNDRIDIIVCRTNNVI